MATTLMAKTFMASKDFLLQRICIFAGREFDPMQDKQVAEVLRTKFDIYLPQRSTVNESLAATNSDHEILSLILQYRTMA